MEIKNSRKKEIVDLFNESIKSYNRVVELRKFKQKSDIVDNFNSVAQYYSAIEAAFKEVIFVLGIEKRPNKLHEMISILIEKLEPCPLEEEIDLFYILRYKDTRNQALHNLDIKKHNPYPRLFLNGQRFIKAYIDKDADFEKFISIESKFSYADFMQKFTTSHYNHIRVLIVGPMHDYDKEKIKVLSSFHWNVVLDFDPYSNKEGLRSVLNSSDTEIVQLSEITNKNESKFSIEYVTWVSCDGDCSLGVDSFSPKNDNKHIPYMPSMLEGPNNWKNSIDKNINKTAKILIENFFNHYFSRMPYNTDLVCLMDYSHPVISSIIDAIERELNPVSNSFNVFFIDESESEKLRSDEENYDNWTIYNTSIYDFLDSIEKNNNIANSDNLVKLTIPHSAEVQEGVITDREYNYVSRNFYLLHSNFPCSSDENSEENSYHDELRNFSRGEEVKWSIISKNDAIKFGFYDNLLRQIESNLKKDSGVAYFDLLHVAGFGGTTISKQIAYDISKNYPVLYMKSYDKSTIGEQIKKIYSISYKRVVIFLEEKLLNNKGADRDECIRIAEATSTPCTFIFVGRRSQDSPKQSSKKQYFIKEFVQEDIEKLLEFNKRIFSDPEEESRKLLNSKPSDFIYELGKENCCPFLINLSIYKDKYIKIDEYVDEFIPSIKGDPVLKKLFIYLCIFSKFVNEGIPLDFAKYILQLEPENLKIELKTYDPLVYLKQNQEFKSHDIAVRAPLIASNLLKKLLMENDNPIGFRVELSKHLKGLIREFKSHFDEKQYAHKRLRQLFIDKIVEESDNDDGISSEHNEMVKKYFAPAIADVWDSDNVEEAGSIFDCLTEEYSNDPYFCAHAARYYAYTKKSFEKAREYSEKALELSLSTEDTSTAPDIYHVKGMCILKELFFELEMLKQESINNQKIEILQLETAFQLVEEAQQAFEYTLYYSSGSNSKSVEYPCSALLKMMMEMLKTLEKYGYLESKNTEKYIETGLNMIQELEVIYVLEEKNDRIDELLRKKNTLFTYLKDTSEALEHWKNFFDASKNSQSYENCLHSCKQRYYILGDKLDDFKNAYSEEYSKNSKKKIESLVEDYYLSFSNIPTSVDRGYGSSSNREFKNLKVSALVTYLSIVRFSTEKIDRVVSIVNSLYVKDAKPDIKVLFYRYVLKFISAYEGDRDALGATIQFLNECKEKAERIARKTNSIEFFRIGSGVNRLISKNYIFKAFPDMKGKIYELDELAYIRGVLKREGKKVTIIPYNTNGRLMAGVEVFVNLKHNTRVNDTDSGQDVLFKMGFSYDGMRAENMSVRLADNNEDNKPAKNEDDLEPILKALNPGELTDFYLEKVFRGQRNNIIALIGRVGVNEKGILHIKKIEEGRKIEDWEMDKLFEYCKNNLIKVYLLSKNDKGWEVSLDKTGIKIDHLIK